MCMPIGHCPRGGGASFLKIEMTTVLINNSQERFV